MADVTLGSGAEDLREYLLNGYGTKDGVYTAWMKAQSGDFVIGLSATTAAPTVAECTAEAQVYTITVTLQTADGETHGWYNGPVKLAIADDDDLGAATISPTAGNTMMANGVATVTVTMSKAAWTAGKKATLTVSDPDTTGFGGWTASDATFIATVAE